MQASFGVLVLHIKTVGGSYCIVIEGSILPAGLGTQAVTVEIPTLSLP